MIKNIFLIFAIFLSNLEANIDQKIEQNEKVLSQAQQKRKDANDKTKEIAKSIEEQNRNILNLEKNIESINLDILKHQNLLESSEKN